MTYRSDKVHGPTAGTEPVDPLEVLVQVLVHIPDKDDVTTRHAGWYANRPRGMQNKAEATATVVPPPIVPAVRLAPTEAIRRWAALGQQIFQSPRSRARHAAGPRASSRSSPSRR